MYKKKNIIKQVVLLSALVFSSVLFTSCDNNNNNLVNIKVEGKGDIPSGIVHKNNGFTYSINFENNCANLLKYVAAEKDVIIPDEIEHNGVVYPVKGYMPDIFKRQNILETVTFEGELISDLSFSNCVNLKKVTFNSSSNYSVDFTNCYNLEEINGGTVNGVYSNCYSLKEVIIPEGVTEISWQCFMNCDSLTSINIPSTLESIDFSSFDQCSSIETITVHEDNQIYDSRDNCNAIIESATNTLIRGCKNTVIPDSVTTISPYAFTGCIGLEEIHIGKNITYIGNFGEEELDYSKPYETLLSAFSNCPDLKTITVDEDNEIYDSRDNCNAIIETATNKLITGCINTIIPDSVTILGNGSFAGCQMEEMNIPSQIEEIHFSVFMNCDKLERITFATNKIKTFNDRLFQNCSSLKTLNMPESVENIGCDVFTDCTSLEKIVISKSFKKLLRIYPAYSSQPDLYLFRGCTRLNEIIVPAGNEKYDSRNNCNAVIETETNRLIAGCKNTKIVNSVKEIWFSAFYECGEIKNVTLPNDIKLCFRAFNGVTIKKLYIPESYNFDVAQFRNSQIKYVEVDEGNEYFDSRDNCNAVINSQDNTLLMMSENAKLPKSINSISSDIFSVKCSYSYIQIPSFINQFNFDYIIDAKQNFNNLKGIIIKVDSCMTSSGFEDLINSSIVPIYIEDTLSEDIIKHLGDLLDKCVVYQEHEWKYVNGYPVPILNI